jgi:ADP-ribosylglycohydrolase
VYGAIAGDIIGSLYEGRPIKTKQFNLFDRKAVFTDDTVLTAATAYAILYDLPYGEAYKKFGRAYPARGYGFNFQNWLASTISKPYGSFGNGSAMRVSPVGWAFTTAAEVLEQARKSAACTHNHPEGIKGAQAVALAVFLARRGKAKKDIREEITNRFGYNLGRGLETIRPAYSFQVSCQESVPEAIIAFLESTDYEDAVRNAVSLGGDSDTQACIAGSIAEAFYGGVPKKIVSYVEKKLDDTILRICGEFYEKVS